MRNDQPERCLKLEKLASITHFDHQDAYSESSSKEKRRVEIAQEISDELQTPPPSRLLTLITQALRYQQIQGVLPAGQQYDLFRQISPDILQPEFFPNRLHGVVKFGKTAQPLSIAFSPDGQHFVTGSSDGLIEIWNFLTCKIRKDISYQASGEFMIHKFHIFCINFSKDGSLLVTGDSEGSIKMWELSSGKCLVFFKKVHQKAVTAVHFSNQAKKILSCSQDETVRVHGRLSKQTLTTLRGHTSFVTDCCWISDENTVLSCSSDGTVKVNITLHYTFSIGQLLMNLFFSFGMLRERSVYSVSNLDSVKQLKQLLIMFNYHPLIIHMF